MNRIFIPLRYFLFFAFASFFAVQISVATWNLQIEQSLTRHDQLDSYLIASGALALLVIFPVTFIDITRKNSLSSRVWFEATWLAIFFLLETAGAAALTALLPELDCHSSGLQDPACSSTSALAGITWTLTILLVLYMTALIIFAILHHDESPDVWHTGVRDFLWFPNTNGKRLPSSPCSPKRWKASIVGSHEKAQAAPVIVTPKPRRTQPPPIWTTYEIEHFQAQDPTDSQPISVSQFPQRPVPTMQQSNFGVRSFYPPHLNQRDPSLPPVPLGAALPSARPSNALASTDSIVTRSHPRGPRNRPPPLDLSQVTTHR